MRASHAERESVFAPPANLADILAKVNAGTPLDDDDDDDGRGRYDDDRGGRGRYDDDRGGRGRGNSEMEGMIEDAQREAEVSRMQAEHLERQLKGAVAELSLHKRHAQEFKTTLEAAEADLAASHEHVTDLSQKLQLAQEGNRRNAEMAQQLLIHLNTARVELKAQTRKNAQLQNEIAALQGEGGAPGDILADASSERLSQRLSEGSCGGAGLGRGGAGWRGSAASESAAVERFGTRAMLTPVTHDVGVQVDLRSVKKELTNSRMGSVAMLALQHARELENVHRELSSRVAPTELVMERRPGKET